MMILDLDDTTRVLWLSYQKVRSHEECLLDIPVCRCCCLPTYQVVCTPHLGASTEEAQINVARDIAVQMCDTLEGKDFVGVCNVGYMGIAQNPAIAPFTELAEQLGR
jgi:hypothetical protein